MALSRLPPLDAFTGKAEDWDSFSRRFKAYCIQQDLKYQALFKLAETTTEMFTDETFADHDDEKKLSLQLHWMLVQLCKGPSEVLLTSLDTEHGLEEWRILHAHYKRPNLNTAVGRLARILDSTFKNMDEDLLKFEAEINKYEKETSSVLPSAIKVAVLMNKTSGSLQQRIRLNANNNTAFNEIKDIILNYTQAQQPFSLGPSSLSTTPMEVDAFGVNAFNWKGKGKDKGKGKGKDRGKGKGKGKGKDGKGPSPSSSWQGGGKPSGADDHSWETPSDGSTSEQWCESCGKRGHTWERCWTYPPSRSSWEGSYGAHAFDVSSSEEKDDKFNKMADRMEKIEKMISSWVPSSSSSERRTNVVHSQPPSAQPARKDVCRGTFGVCAFTTKPPENDKNKEKSFKEEFLDFQTELFMDLDEKFEKMAENLKDHTEDLLDRREQEMFTKMDHESFKSFVGFKFDIIKTSVDALIGSAHQPEKHFIGDETFKEEDIEDEFKDALEVLDSTPSTSSPMTSTTPSPRCVGEILIA